MTQYPQSLADYLGVTDIRPEADRPELVEVDIDISDPVEFCKKIVASREFRQYIANGYLLGNLPAPITLFIMGHAMGKPVERVEHTGKDGGPIAVTEVRRVIIRAGTHLEETDSEPLPSEVTH